ncbi:helix-turn-helix domain-containing protein [Mycobacterium sp. ELW1]|uniref:helix-turn-helix domain-containing protein n=1 Tax=Mycobacterium sp. ELW1 TaxID=1547487 RepID=UPI0011EECA7E|nr:helix-turn-helix domain-containing protein [Mycobacterium sp. ELW1]QEN15926.1 hypothetical protein D3H54_23945 [Mycobacterium sp. ELW1]
MNSTGVIDKFNGWLDVVLREEKLTGMDKAILAAVAVFYTRNGEPSFAVRQSTLADRCGTTERSVRRAFCAATDLGYLLLVEERQRGRGHRGGDRYALSLPERPDTCVRYSGGKYRTHAPKLPDTCVRKDRTKPTPKTVSHMRKRKPHGFLTGLRRVRPHPQSAARSTSTTPTLLAAVPANKPAKTPSGGKPSAPSGCGARLSNDAPPSPDAICATNTETSSALTESPPTR